MADNARKKTDKRLREIENRVREIYRTSQAEITAQWNEYMENGSAQLRGLYLEYVHAKNPRRQEAKKAYQEALQLYTLQNNRYKAMLENTARNMANANNIALAYVNGIMPEIYAINYNQTVPGLPENIRFDLVDEYVIRRRIVDGDIQLPNKKLNIPKDMRWNTRMLNSAVLQGILQGESMLDIAKRILPIVSNNEKAAIRNARTMVTGAENRGRLDRYQNLESQGVIMYKMWIATGDDRTRDWHLSLDGQEVPTDEPFIDGLGNELEYPGDHTAPGITVYNCRCSMKGVPKGIRGRNGQVKMFGRYSGDGEHQREIENERNRRK